MGMVVLCATVAQAQTLYQTRHVIASGAVSASNGATRMHATVGQPIIGPVAGSSSRIGQGFWHPMSGASSVETTPPGIPANFTLDQNFPNPFSPATLIRFTVAQSARVILNVYSIKGELVRTLVDGNLEPGAYNVDFLSDDLPSGTYIYTLETGGHSLTKRMTLAR